MFLSWKIQCSKVWVYQVRYDGGPKRRGRRWRQNGGEDDEKINPFQIGSLMLIQYPIWKQWATPGNGGSVFVVMLYNLICISYVYLALFFQLVCFLLPFGSKPSSMSWEGDPKWLPEYYTCWRCSTKYGCVAEHQQCFGTVFPSVLALPFDCT